MLSTPISTSLSTSNIAYAFDISHITSDITGITSGIRALSSLNLAENNLGELVLPEGWTEDYDSEDEEVYRHADGREQKDNPGRPEGIIAIANVISDMGALYKLILKNNKLATAEAGEALGEALAGNTVLKELDISRNYWDDTEYGGWTKGDGPGFAKGISKGLTGNGALTKLDISSNYIRAEQEGDLQRICAAGGIELAK
jgi:Leucine-rich repeat (LRR) protein